METSVHDNIEKRRKTSIHTTLAVIMYRVIRIIHRLNLSTNLGTVTCVFILFVMSVKCLFNIVKTVLRQLGVLTFTLVVEGCSLSLK